MERKLLFVVCCVLWPRCCLAMSVPLSRQELKDFFVRYIQRTSRLDRLIKVPIKLENNIAKMNTSFNNLSPSVYEDEEGYAWESGDKFEGDMILNRRQRLQITRDVTSGGPLRNGLRSLSKRWPNNEVIYYFKKGHFSPEQEKAIKEAMKSISNVSCIKFRKYKKGDKHSVVVQGKESGCYSAVGYQKKSVQLMNLSAGYPVGKGCLKRGTIQHELLHTLGFFHMHSSTNRDEFVRVHWENIIPKKRIMFMKYTTDEITDFGIEYEYYSVMHYSRKARSKNGKDTLEPLRDPNFHKAQRDGMTYRDIRKLNLMYCGE